MRWLFQGFQDGVGGLALAGGQGFRPVDTPRMILPLCRLMSTATMKQTLFEGQMCVLQWGHRLSAVETAICAYIRSSVYDVVQFSPLSNSP